MHVQVNDDFVHHRDDLTPLIKRRYNPPAYGSQTPKGFFEPEVSEAIVTLYLNIALIITSIALIASVILQSKGAGLGGLTGGDTGGIFTARRGIEKILFRVTILLAVIFFILIIATVIVQH
jgi:preprotein translocase subunit SecG